MNELGLVLRACALLAGLALALPAGRAEAAWSDVLQDGHGGGAGAQQTFVEKAEQAIVVGGVLLYRHRHAVAGAAIGCVAGSMAATTTAVGAGLATGGAALAGSRAGRGARLRARRARRRRARPAPRQRLRGALSDRRAPRPRRRRPALGARRLGDRVFTLGYRAAVR